MGFRTMGEFQQALGELVAKANGSRRRRPRGRKKSRSQARSNMALRYDGVEFDTVDELLAYKDRADSRRPQVAAEREPPAWAPTPTGGKRPRVKRTEGGADMPTKSEARRIARAVGGWAGFCPAASGSGVTPADALGGMGLTHARAVQVLAAFEAAGIPSNLEKPQTDPTLAARARDILTTVGKVRCQVAKSNGAFVNWTAYPQYAYDAFARNNSGRPSQARPNAHDAVIAKFVPDPLVQNAGPYTPHIYPYGVVGIPGCYAVKNEAAPRTRRASVQLAHAPVSGDRQQALGVLQDMAGGRGGDGAHARYPAMIRKLAKLFPIEDERNRQIWTFYRRHRDQIVAFAPFVPTIAKLRGVA